MLRNIPITHLPCTSSLLLWNILLSSRNDIRIISKRYYLLHSSVLRARILL
jgi:hypothetical protein